MKVTYDPQIFSGQIYGGISRYICEVATRISIFKGVDVKLIAPMHVNAYLKKVPKDLLVGFESPFPYDFLRLGQRASSMLIGDFMLRSMKSDVIHETYYFKFPIGPKNSVRVLTVHDMIHEKFQSQFPYGDKTSKHKEYAVSRADHIICVSESTKRDAIEILGLSPDKVTVIPLGFDLMLDKSFGQNSLETVTKPYLLYVGSRGGYKNFLALLETYASSFMLRKEFNLVCFGGGGFSENELNAIRNFGVSKEQVMQISGGDELLSKLYQNASVLVFPSLYEGFGIPPLEAMSYGCPVVCSNTSSIPEVVGDAGKYFDPYDLDGMRAAIEEVVASQLLRDSLVDKGKHRIKLFSWDKCAVETLNVYRSLL